MTPLKETGMLAGRINPIIVNYGTPDLVLKCVQSILHFGVADAADVIVVDNASPDDSAERLKDQLPPGVVLIASDRNAGFSAGINTGLARADKELVLVLNPDTYFADTSLERVLALLDANATVGLVGLDLIYPDGERQYSARRFYSVLDILGRRLPIGRYWPIRPRIDRHMMKPEWASMQPFDAEWVMGTGFVCRRDLFMRLGGMDEAYFLYMEDVDLCARVWHAGFRVVCVPGATLVHDHQRSSAQSPFGWAGRMHLKSLGIFRKRYRIPLLVPPGVEHLKR
jgi:N-acetylglucosaminyl-diphospho-decaprenol L-rhamnosyltransferase